MESKEVDPILHMNNVGLLLIQFQSPLLQPFLYCWNDSLNVLFRFSSYLNIMFLPGSGELTVFLAAILGASLGFLWFNAHPAKVFMGDTGSLAMGGAIAAAAILLRKEIQLLIVGGVFAAEALSVIIQIASYKLRKGKRVFLMAPLHHHFELKGWPESQVVVRFWIISAMLALLSLSTFKIR